MSEKRFLSKSEVREKVKLSYAEIARREKKMKFPTRLLEVSLSMERLSLNEIADSFVLDRKRHKNRFVGHVMLLQLMLDKR